MFDSNFKMDQKLDYLHKNPVVAGYVAMPSMIITAVRKIMREEKEWFRLHLFNKLQAYIKEKPQVTLR